MQNVVISRYKNTHHGWAGNIEPEDRSWILFVHDDGSSPHLMVHRDISEEEAKIRELNTNVKGEYVDPEDLKEGEKPTPNRPVAAVTG